MYKPYVVYVYFFNKIDVRQSWRRFYVRFTLRMTTHPTVVISKFPNEFVQEVFIREQSEIIARQLVCPDDF